jgi:hypothetical protein
MLQPGFKVTQPSVSQPPNGELNTGMRPKPIIPRTIPRAAVAMPEIEFLEFMFA